MIWERRIRGKLWPCLFLWGVFPLSFAESLDSNAIENLEFPIASSQYLSEDKNSQAVSNQYMNKNSQTPLENPSVSSLSAEEMSAYLRQSLEEQRKIREMEKEMAQDIKNNPLKIAYTLLHDKESGRVCYIEAFGREDIVPDFAEPADYKSADLSEPPPFPKCSKEEELFVVGYQNQSYLSLDMAALQLPAIIAGVSICYIVGHLNYDIFKKIIKSDQKPSIPLEDLRFLFMPPFALTAIFLGEGVHYSTLFFNHIYAKITKIYKAPAPSSSRIGHTPKSLKLSQSAVKMAGSRILTMSVLGAVCSLMGAGFAIYHVSEEPDLEYN